jgi:hypothetical protein
MVWGLRNFQKASTKLVTLGVAEPPPSVAAVAAALALIDELKPFVSFLRILT